MSLTESASAGGIADSTVGSAGGSSQIISSMADWLGTGQYPAHGFCLLWDSRLVALSWLGHSGTAIAYIIIPIMLLYAGRKYREYSFFPFWAVAEIAAFIVCCAISHVISVAELYYPIYWLDAVWINITGFVSLMTAVTLPFAIVSGIRNAAIHTVTKVIKDPDGRLHQE